MASVRPFPDACVVDASVLAKYFLPEEGTDLATGLIRAGLSAGPSALVVPDFGQVECANILWKRVRRGLLTPDLARQHLLDLTALPLQIWPAGPLLERALVLAIAHDVTVYDAAYLALADVLPLITADAALVRKAAGSGILVMLLDDFR